MKKSSGFALLVAVSSVVLADTNGDAVNERIPVNKAELEDHWEVDCAATWARFQTAAGRPGPNLTCGISGELVRDLQLCAFIYQAPGDTAGHACPDYRGVYQYLEQAADPTACPALPASILQKWHCPGAGL